jgi:hypothetical protein
VASRVPFCIWYGECSLYRPRKFTRESVLASIKTAAQAHPQQAGGFSTLLRAVKNAQLVDLHTHLLGMGDADFWLHVMDKLATISAAATWDHRYVECYLAPLTCANYLDAQPIDQETFEAQYHEEIKTMESDGYTHIWDVVYPVTTILSALDAQDQNEMALKLPNKFWSSQIGKYCVWNARGQRWSKIDQGIPNSVLLKLMTNPNHGAAIRAELRKFFSMDVDEVGPSMVKEAFWQHFTPQFYPRRYTMKDPMYEQYPIVLDMLLDHVLGIYEAAGVAYVEFSVGFGDLIDRPQIFRHLLQPQLSQQTSVSFRYLAGFGRHTASFTLPFDNCVDVAFRLLSEHDTVPSHYDKYFQEDLKLLARLEERFAECPLLREMCVGLDYMGDELSRPACPFGLATFRQFLAREREARGGQFGFRFHCGELDEATLTPRLLAHLAISSLTIADILRDEQLRHHPASPVLRLGHGIAFRHILGGASISLHYGAEHQLRTFVAGTLALLANRCPIEVNLTSNAHLQNSPVVLQLPQTLIAADVSCFLATDNDGIWSSTGVPSVAGEYCRALAGYAAEEGYAFAPAVVTRFIGSARASSFSKLPQPALHIRDFPQPVQQRIPDK